MQSALYFLRKLRRIVFGKTDIDVFQKDAVKVFRAVDILRCPLRGGNERLMVLLQTLLVDGDLYGIASETVDGIHEYDIPRHRLFAVQ